MSRRARRDRPPRLPDRPAPSARVPRVAAPPSAARQLVLARVCGAHPSLGPAEVLAAARRLARRTSLDGTEPVTLDEARDALEHVAGPQTGRRPSIDPDRALAAAADAGARLAAVARQGGRVAFATAAPASLLTLHAAVGAAAREAGADLVEADAAGPYAPGRWVWWPESVAVATDTVAVLAEHRADAAAEWLFAVGRPDLVVADGVFAHQAIAEGLPAVAVADLDDPLPFVAALRGQATTVVPAVTTRPPAAYRALVGALTDALAASPGANGLGAHDGDGNCHRPHLATETPGPYAAPESGGGGEG